MEAHCPDRVVRVLTLVVSVAYYGLLAGAAVVLAAVPVVRLFAGDRADWILELTVPATVIDPETNVRASWGAARLVIEDVRGSLRLPIAMMPGWLVAVLWTHAAVVFALMLLSLHHLRRIFQRVRDGIPFDARNALRLRWLGLLLLALAAVNALAELVTSLAVRDELVSSSIRVATGLRIDLPVVFVALVLVALAEIFRRGAELENEQSLVI